MSISTVDIIMWRIESATERSPIAVFRLPEKCGELKAVFGATVETRRQIAAGDPMFLGLYHKGMNPFEIEKELSAAA